MDVSMEGDNVQTETQDQNVEIKKEPKEKSPWLIADETINLISDDEQDEQAGISAAPTDIERVVDVCNGATPANVTEKVDSTLAREQVMAMQNRLVNKYLQKQNEEKSNATSNPTKADETEEEEEDPATQFANAKKLYERKKKANTLSLEDEIAFIRMQSEEMTRIRKQQADEDFDRMPTEEEGEGLFVSDAEPMVPKLFEELSEDEAITPKKRGRNADTRDNDTQPPKKRARKSTKVLGADYTEDDVESIILKARQSATKTKAKPKGNQKAKPKGNAKPKKVISAKSKAKGPKVPPTQMTNVRSLLGNDVFKDAEATAGLADQPTFFDQTRRDNALKQLIASVPAESAKVARSDKRYLEEAIKSFTGHASVKAAPDGGWDVKGMKSSLKHYQILGTAFMRRREGDAHHPKGGILADEMGLGKTIMMLANIINGKPKEKGKPKTTLIVASPALVTQWAQEVRTHCQSTRESKQHGIGMVMEYRAGSRIHTNDDTGFLESADIVLTTYHDVMKSWPKAVFPSELVTSEQKNAYWHDELLPTRGILHKIKFLRVVLDEAQAIKNHRSQTSVSCRALEAKHYWAITGTPIMNNLMEFYPYFKFLREPNTGSYKIFKENFCDQSDPEGIEKLNVFLRKFMIRRTHLDKLFDARLLDLPTPTERTIWLEFHEVERQVYDIVKRRFINRVNHLASQGLGALNKSYSHIWVMILRLRQLCSHPLLIQGPICDLLEREDFERLQRITSEEDESKEEGEALLVHLRNVLSSAALTKQVEGGISSSVFTENEALATGVVDIGSTQGETGGQHGKRFPFRKYLDQIKNSDNWDAIAERCVCAGCRQPPNDPYITSCFHIFCKSRLRDLQHLAARRGQDHARCSECGETYTSSQPCEDPGNLKGRETSASSDLVKENMKGKKKKEEDDWLSMPGQVLPSAKTRATKAALMNIFQETPDAKVIVYTQFLGMVRILSRVCQTEDWGYCTYTGGMSHDNRNKAIHEFGHDKSKKILLASLKCGGLGLNLTMASRVILLDPYWNQSIEHQAFCRVFRIGQKVETQMTRFYIKNTVDSAMMGIKERKQVEIDKVMNSAQLSERLSVKDLMRLFGNRVGEDEEGKPFIFAAGNAQDDEDIHLRFPNPDDDEDGMGDEE